MAGARPGNAEVISDVAELGADVIRATQAVAGVSSLGGELGQPLSPCVDLSVDLRCDGVEKRYIRIAVAKKGTIARCLGDDVSILASCLPEK